MELSNIFVSLAMLFLFADCHSPSNEPSKEPDKTRQTTPVSNDWIRDKEGCLKLRNIELAHKLIEENNLKNGTKDSFFKVFGIANKVDSSTANEEVLIYYFACVCINNKINMEGDKCYANFYFEKGKLKSEEFICE